MQSKLCPHCHSGGRARLAAPCRDACDLLLMVLCRATGLSRVPVRFTPHHALARSRTRDGPRARAARVLRARTWAADLAAPALQAGLSQTRPSACTQQSLAHRVLLAHVPVMGQTCRCPSAIAVGSVRSGATQAAVTADAYRCASRRAQVTAPCVCDDLECAREDHWEMTWTGLWSVNATRQTRGDLCPFTLFAMLF